MDDQVGRNWSTYPDLTSRVTTVATELNRNGSGTEVRCHGKVGDTSDSQDDNGNLVEKTGSSRSLQMDVRHRHEAATIFRDNLP